MSHGPGRRSVGMCLALLGAAFAIGSLTGCEVGPPPSPEVRRSRFPIEYQNYARLGYRLDWIGYPALSSSVSVVELVAPGGDAVLALDSGGIVTCLSTVDGSTRWSDQLTGSLTRFLSLDRDGNRALVTSESEIFALDMSTGNLVDRQEYTRLVSTRPIPYGNTLIYGSGVGEVFAHVAISSIDKAKAWGHLLPEGIDRNLVLVGGAVGVVSRRGDVVFLDAASGALVGRNSIYKGTATHPVADGTAMYVACLDQSVYAFAPAGGRLLWQYRTPVPLRQQPTVHNGTLYVGVDGTGLVALDAASGKPRWTAPEVSGTVVAANGDRLFVWDGASAILLDSARGDIIEKVALPRVRALIPDKFEAGNMYAVSHSGVVARFLPR